MPLSPQGGIFCHYLSIYLLIILSIPLLIRPLKRQRQPPKLHQTEMPREMRRSALALALLASASAFQLRPCAGRTAAARPVLAQPPRILLAEEGSELPSLPTPFADDSLIQFSTLSEDYQKVLAPDRGTIIRWSECHARPSLRRWCSLLSSRETRSASSPVTRCTLRSRVWWSRTWSSRARRRG